MGGDDEPAWWTAEGIATRWDHEQNTGPPRVIVAKFIREGAFPLLAGSIAGGIVFVFATWLGVLSANVFSVVVGAVGGVFLLFYLEAGFKDSTLRGD